jgi:hypothetical protein
MDDAWLDRLLGTYHAERSHLHAQTGRFLTLALITLALIQFAVLDGGLHARAPARFAGFLVVGLSIGWLFFAPIPQYLASGANRVQGTWTRIRSAWREYGILPVFSYIFLAFAAVASGGTTPVITGTTLGILVLIGMGIDIGGFTAMQVWKPHRVFLLLLLPRLLVGGTVAAYGSGLDPSTITNAERALAVWPVLATVIAALWCAWSFNALLRGLRPTAKLARILRDYTAGDISEPEIAAQYHEWVRHAMGGNHAPPLSSRTPHVGPATE